ncbi:MAG: alkaline phosphatase family protein [Candidatus Aenigmatarchaeota archaeon]
MILREIEDIIKKEKKKGEFVYPFYEKYCFSNIPSTILELYGIKSKRPALPLQVYKDKVETNVNKIVFFLLDGFGYHHWTNYFKEHKFFDRVTKRGVVFPLTTIFPSTTAAALTTINTGLTSQEHALFEWFLYFKEIDMIISTLQFTPLGIKGQDRLLEFGIDPRILFRGKTIHQTLKKAGIKSFTFINEQYAWSAYSQVVHKGSVRIPFINCSDLVVRLRKQLEAESGPAYFYAYIGDIDALEHRYGPRTEEYHAELSMLSFLLKKELLEKIDRKTAKETLILITSDHGQLNVSPKDTVYLNKYSKLVNSFQRCKNGKPILPTGSPRDVFLHIEESKLEETYNFLSEKLKEKAKVVKTEEAIREGLLGIGKPKKEFYERVGNLLILPYKNNTFWYEYFKGWKMDLLGHHGGLSKDEMLIPFAICRLYDLL